MPGGKRVLAGLLGGLVCLAYALDIRLWCAVLIAISMLLPDRELLTERDLVQFLGQVDQGFGQIGEGFVKSHRQHFLISLLEIPVVYFQAIESNCKTSAVHAVQAVDKTRLAVDGLDNGKEALEALGAWNIEWSKWNGDEIETFSQANLLFKLDRSRFFAKIDYGGDAFSFQLVKTGACWLSTAQEGLIDDFEIGQVGLVGIGVEIVHYYLLSEAET